MRFPFPTRISQILENKDYKRIFENILSLFSLQGLNYLLPLITFPYLTRVLGPDKYGLVAFALAFMGYFQILTDYGFNLSATREISINRHDEAKVSSIFSSVMATKSLLTLLSFFMVMVIVFSFERFRSDWLLYFFTFGLVVGNLLLPTWFFQGMEKMKYISILNMGITLIYTVSIFIFIRNTSDFIYVPLISSLGSIVIGIVSLILVHRYFNVNFILPTFADIKYQLQDGWHVFISTAATSLYSISNPFILGFFASNTMVGYYSVAEKIVRVVSGLFNPISQSVYPYISTLALKSKEEAISFIQKLTLLIGTLNFVLSLGIIIFAGFIIFIFAGTQYDQSVLILQIMAFIPFVVALSTTFGVQTMLTFNYKEAFSHIILISSVIHIILSVIMAYFFQAVGIAVAVLITESIVTISMYLYLRRKGINLLDLKNIKTALKTLK
ncbi:MAG: flippase [Methanobacteriaceae archaeon]